MVFTLEALPESHLRTRGNHGSTRRSSPRLCRRPPPLALIAVRMVADIAIGLDDIDAPLVSREILDGALACAPCSRPPPRPQLRQSTHSRRARGPMQPVVSDGDAGNQGGDTEGDVGDSVNSGNESSTIVGTGECGKGPEGSHECRSEPDARHRRSDKHCDEWLPWLWQKRLSSHQQAGKCIRSSIAVGGLMVRNTTADTAPKPVSKKIITPPHRSFFANRSLARKWMARATSSTLRAPTRRQDTVLPPQSFAWRCAGCSPADATKRALSWYPGRRLGDGQDPRKPRRALRAGSTTPNVSVPERTEPVRSCRVHP